MLGLSNSGWEEIFLRSLKELKKYQFHYCSRSCATIINNFKSPKRKKKIIKNFCKTCSKSFFREGLFCSLRCKHKGQIISKEKIIDHIKNFYTKNRRVPFKQEFKHAHAAHKRFGSWNNAIRAAGF